MKTQTPKVLIVDDEPRNLRLLGAMVAPIGVETHTASSGGQALEMILKVSPDVILLDIMMPDMDGIEVCRKLKENRTTRNIPVVFVTALEDIKYQASAIEAGGIGFIIKPVQQILVHASVKNAIRLKQLSDEVDELMQQRASLTSMIVHDINNLLSVNLAYAQIMLLDNTLPPKVMENLARIEKSAKDIQAMTSSLLEVEKFESGTMPISLEAVDTGQLVEQRAKLLILQATERGIRLELPKPVENAIVLADRALLSRVLDNLISNAVKFCPDQGAIEIKVSANEGSGEVAVTNDGLPIPPEYHERIFEKFAQVEFRQATGRKGVGLGLAFCKMALEVMGGTIAVESPVAGREDGTRFVFRLPLERK